MTTQTNVVRLPRAAKLIDRRRKQAVRISRSQALAAGSVGTVALVLTALSLTHLSHGIEMVTHSPVWESWAMAFGIDAGFVAIELAMLCPMSDKTARAIKSYATWAIGGTLVGSAALNALAFGAQAEGYMLYPAVIFGLAVPALIYAMTRIGATIWMGRAQ